MKKYFINPALAVVFILLTVMSGCLKDKDYDNGLIQSLRNNGQNQNIIELQLTATDVTNFLLLSLDAVDKDTVINLVPVVLASPNVAKEDIHVTLVANPTLVSDYNTANGTAYAIPPASMYTIVNQGLVVTIPAGSRVGYLQATINPSDFLGGDWALGYAIASIDKPGYAISGNLDKGIVAIGIKNQYDGNYRSKGFFVHPTPANNSSWTFADGITRDLITFSGNGVYIYPLETKAVVFGVELDLTVNADNTVTTVFLGTTDDPDAVPNPSHYDPSTRTFYIDAWYGGHTRHLVDTLEYVRSR